MRRALPLVCVLLIAFALRTYRLADAPPGLYYDEAANGIDALDVLAGRHPIFFTGNQGREPLHIYAIAIATALLGPGWLAIRLPSLLVGTATVAASYLLGREAAGRRVGLLAALLLATSYWHVSLSRMGFRAVWVPLVGALALALWLRGLRTGRWTPLALAGLVLGGGFYTYLAARLLPLPLAATALWRWLVAPVSSLPEGEGQGEGVPIVRRGIPSAWQLLVPLGVAALVGAPLAAYFLRHPELFWERVQNARGGDLSPLARIAAAAGTIVWAGDPQPRHNLAAQPAFEPLAAALFLIGVAVCLARLRHSGHVGVLATSALMLLPPALATGEPHFLRAVGVLPAAQVVAAVGLDRVLVRIPRAALRRSLVVALALFWTAVTARDYFGVWAPSRAAYEAFEGQARDAARLIVAESPGAAAAAGGPIYAGRPTYYLGGPPAAPFDGAHAVVRPRDESLVVLAAPPHLPELLRARLGEPFVLAGRWSDPDGGPSVAAYRPGAGAFELASRLPASFGQAVGFEGYELPTIVPPGGSLTALLTWRVRGPAQPGLYQFAHVLGPGATADRTWAKQDAESFPSRAWRGGERVLSAFELAMPTDAPIGAYWVATGFYAGGSLARRPVADAAGRPAGDRLLLGPFKLWDRARAVPPPPRAAARFAGGLLLAAAELPAAVRPADPLSVRLTWWSVGPTAAPLTVFVHLLDGGDQSRAGADSPPLAGANPTDLWQPGESIVDPRQLTVPADTPPGQYRVEVGLYDPTTGARLRLVAADRRLGDAAIVGVVRVGN